MPEGASTAWCWCFRALTKSLSERVSLSAWQAGTSAEHIYSNLWKKRIWLQQGIYTTHQSAGRERDNKGQTEREKRGGGVWFGVVVLLVLLNLHTDMHKSAHTQTFTQFFFLAVDVGPESSLVFQFQSPSLPRSNTWGGNWRRCHYPTAVPTTQCYTHAICTYDCVCVCVLAKRSTEVKSLSVSRSLILSSFRILAILHTMLKATAWIRFSPCGYVTHTNVHTHTPGTPIVAAGNGMGEEWEREGKRGNAGKLLQLAYQKQSKDNNILFTQKEATRRTDRVRAPWKWSESRYRQYRTSVSFWGLCFSFILFVKLNTDLSYFSVIYLHFSVLAKTKLKGFVWNRVAKIMTNHMRFKFIYVYKWVNYTIM